MVKRPASGFTLIEMMVTIAIVGILAGLATQGWMAFQRRAHQGEAKVNLSLLYASQKNFYARYGAYNPANLTATGFAPQGRRRYQYELCFPGPNTRTISGFPGVPAIEIVSASSYPYAWGSSADCTWNNPCGRYPCDTGPYATNNPQAFTSMAASMLCSSCHVDLWAIDETKNLRNTSNGTR